MRPGFRKVPEKYKAEENLDSAAWEKRSGRLLRAMCTLSSCFCLPGRNQVAAGVGRGEGFRKVGVRCSMDWALKIADLLMILKTLRDEWPPVVERESRCSKQESVEASGRNAALGKQAMTRLQ